MDKTAFNKAVSNAIYELRERHNLSAASMADVCNIERRRYYRLENGEIAPTVAEYVGIFNAMGETALRPSLEILYPDIYKEENYIGDVKKMREAAADYILNYASSAAIEHLYFLMKGEHGSNYLAQIQEILMLDHMPMAYRYVIAGEIMQLWEYTQATKTVVCSGKAMPDEEMFMRAYEQGKKAAFENKNSYSTAFESEGKSNEVAK